MAFPAMITASAVTALLIWAAIPDWSFWICWLIGIILSATDPVAVVALLKELGASKALGTLIEGESLLNDGSAVVLFSWVRNAIGYSSATLPPYWMLSGGYGGAHLRYEGNVGIDLAVTISQMLLFGAAFGYLFGLATVEFCKFNYNALYIEGPMVLAMSYLCFWLGELVCGTSAVIAVVVMGLVVNTHKSDISSSVFEFLHHFYGMAAHILNTVIFAIAGAKLGELLVDGNLLELWQDYPWQIPIIYPIILFARGFAIVLFYPALKRLGTGCTWQEAVVMWWGGLRGSIGLALALIIKHTQYDEAMWGHGCHAVEHGSGRSTISLDCRDQPAAVVAMTIIVVACTVIINAVTMAPLMKLLRMTELSEARKLMVMGSYTKLHGRTAKKLGELKAESSFFTGVDWANVQSLDLATDVYQASTIQKMELAAWLSVLGIERASYDEQFEQGMLSPQAYEMLEDFMALLLTTDY